MRQSVLFICLVIVMSLVAPQEKIHKEGKRNIPVLKGAPRPAKLPETTLGALSAEIGGENATVANAAAENVTIQHSTAARSMAKGTNSEGQRSGTELAA
ncbi:hypothetical protein BV25DRAFT_1130611 [Artomyces pyxidatus]|uniref:Uncharacterized protein n=1 Tax=Artomyces pyxidatus TaxID=48021 RepID=A0ACB8SSA3_9AGAM|nr:hypothetical protein BV25DRAFT_1130611 [Artomyces pyxidatus]